MSLKVLCFGENSFLKKLMARLRAERRGETDDEIIVDNIDVRGKTFLVFSITNPELIGSQAPATSGLIYFLSPNEPLFEQKQFFYNIIAERKQFEGLPAVILYDKQQNLELKEIINCFELFKVKDRASMIREVDIESLESIQEVFVWIDSHFEFRKTRTFDAPPKIVKIKPKYRQSEPESTEKKYENIIKEKRFKGLNVKEQQQTYIELEKQRIKNENMEKQLANFNKNKKKMAPYDIKATPNPKIQANLHFFLKDGRVEKPQQVNLKIQTDEFKQKPREKPYVPKKTGVNISTQIEPTELFDFGKEVQPILDILTTRALEAAALEIEEEQEMLKIAKYKHAYSERIKKQKKHEQEKIDQEVQAIKEKEKILEVARKKDQAKKQITKKLSHYAVADTFLQNIYKDAAFSLYKKNLYPNEFEHALKTDYLPEVLKRSLQSYEKILANEQALQNVFDKSCLDTIVTQRQTIRQQHTKRAQEKLERRINKGDTKRYINVLYDTPEHKKFTSFAKYLPKQLQGRLEECLKQREDQIQQAEDKHQGGQLDESEVLRVKDKDNANFATNHNSLLINDEKAISFQVTENKYEKPTRPQNFVPACLLLDRQGNLVHRIQSEADRQQYANVVHDLRNRKDLINFDSGIVLNLQQVPQKIHSVVFYLKIVNIGPFLQQLAIKTIKQSAYQLQFYNKAIPIYRHELSSTVKWEQLIKPAEVDGDANPEAKNQKPKQSLYIYAYHLVRRGRENWQAEEVNTASKLVEEPKSEEFVERVAGFYKQSLEIFKSDDDDPKPTPKLSSRNSKRKSKKNIVQQKQAVKNQVKLTSRVLKEVEVSLHDSWSHIFNRIGDSIVDWKQFIENSPDGWHLQFRGRRLENAEQIRKFNKLGDIQLRKVVPVVEEEKPVLAEGGNEDPADD